MFNQISAHKSKESIFCIAMHPMGLQIAAGFKDKLKIYYLLEDEVRPAIDFQSKNCYSARYSNGGQYLAAASNNVIWVIDPYTFELKFQLHGHPSPVRILSWNESDSMLLSVCQAGSAYGWHSNFEIYNKEKKNTKKKDDAGGNKIEFIMKNVVIHSLGYDEEFDLMYVASSDNKLTLFSTDNGRGCKNYLQLSTGDCELTSLLLGKQQGVLFAGTSKGSIRVYLWPMLKRKQQTEPVEWEYMEYSVHSGRVVSLQLSADKQSVVSCAVDGTVYVLAVKEVSGSNLELEVSKKKRTVNKCKVHLNMN